MKSSLILAAFLAIAGASPVNEDLAVRTLLTSLEQGFIIDTDARPSYSSGFFDEPTCAPYWYKCKRLKFSTKELLREGAATAWYTVNVEHAMANNNDAPARITLTASTTSTVSRTKGWTVGAKLSTSASINGSNMGVEVSASYSDSTTAGKTETRTVSTETTCAPGYECRVETWTFHLTFKGECEKRAMFDCGGEHDICREPWDGCSQLIAYRWKSCRDGAETKVLGDCEARTPILDQSGKPMARLVLIANKMLEGPAKRDDQPETIVTFLD